MNGLIGVAVSAPAYQQRGVILCEYLDSSLDSMHSPTSWEKPQAFSMHLPLFSLEITRITSD